MQQMISKAKRIIKGHWLQVKDGDPRASWLYKRHYSCQQYKDRRRYQTGYRNRHLILGPGEKMVLITLAADALFGWRRFIDDSGQQGINCAVFRNESPLLSSELILEAEELAWRKWPGERLYTYVDPIATSDRRSRHHKPGHCFRISGWEECGVTATKGLVILEKLPYRGKN
jgi:hypothetical protein